ncbi:MAG: hypothetical protein Q7K34_03260 [archaeon]|nr:hypothetical protein [archaeon]
MNDKKISVDNLALDRRVKTHLGAIEEMFKPPVHLPAPMSRRKRAVLSEIARIVAGKAGRIRFPPRRR